MNFVVTFWVSKVKTTTKQRIAIIINILFIKKKKKIPNVKRNYAQAVFTLNLMN
jgi:hypothetical protein